MQQEIHLTSPFIETTDRLEGWKRNGVAGTCPLTQPTHSKHIRSPLALPQCKQPSFHMWVQITSPNLKALVREND